MCFANRCHMNVLLYELSTHRLSKFEDFKLFSRPENVCCDLLCRPYGLQSKPTPNNNTPVPDDEAESNERIEQHSAEDFRKLDALWTPVVTQSGSATSCGKTHAADSDRSPAVYEVKQADGRTVGFAAPYPAPLHSDCIMRRLNASVQRRGVSLVPPQLHSPVYRSFSEFCRDLRAMWHMYISVCGMRSQVGVAARFLQNVCETEIMVASHAIARRQGLCRPLPWTPPRRQLTPTALSLCKRVLADLLADPRVSSTLAAEVNPLVWGLQYYFELVPHPLALSTVGTWLEIGAFPSVGAFRHALCRVYRNLRRYYKALSDFAEKLQVVTARQPTAGHGSAGAHPLIAMSWHKCLGAVPVSISKRVKDLNVVFNRSAPVAHSDDTKDSENADDNADNTTTSMAAESASAVPTATTTTANTTATTTTATTTTTTTTTAPTSTAVSETTAEQQSTPAEGKGGSGSVPMDVQSAGGDNVKMSDSAASAEHKTAVENEQKGVNVMVYTVNESRLRSTLKSTSPSPTTTTAASSQLPASLRPSHIFNISRARRWPDCVVPASVPAGVLDIAPRMLQLVRVFKRRMIQSFRRQARAHSLPLRFRTPKDRKTWQKSSADAGPSFAPGARFSNSNEASAGFLVSGGGGVGRAGFGAGVGVSGGGVGGGWSASRAGGTRALAVFDKWVRAAAQLRTEQAEKNNNSNSNKNNNSSSSSSNKQRKEVQKSNDKSGAADSDQPKLTLFQRVYGSDTPQLSALVDPQNSYLRNWLQWPVAKASASATASTSTNTNTSTGANTTTTTASGTAQTSSASTASDGTDDNEQRTAAPFEDFRVHLQHRPHFQWTAEVCSNVLSQLAQDQQAVLAFAKQKGKADVVVDRNHSTEEAVKSLLARFKSAS